MNNLTIQSISKQIYTITKSSFENYFRNQVEFQPQLNSMIETINRECLQNILKHIHIQSSYIDNLYEQNQYLRTAIQMMQKTIQQIRQQNNTQNQNKFEQKNMINMDKLKESLKTISEDIKSNDSYQQLVRIEQQIVLMSNQLVNIQEECRKQQRKNRQIQKKYKQEIRQLKNIIVLCNNQKDGSKNTRHLILSLKQKVKILQQQSVIIKENTKYDIKNLQTQIMLEITQIHRKCTNSFQQTLVNLGVKQKVKKDIKKKSIAEINKKFCELNKQNICHKDKISKILSS